MRHNDWKGYSRRQALRRALQEQTTPDLYAPRPALKSDDAIEAEIDALKEAEQRMIARLNSAICEIFAQAAEERRAA